MFTPQSANPFVLLMDPTSVVASMEASTQLRSLQRHECHPLDRRFGAGRKDTDAFDALIDAMELNLEDETMFDDEGDESIEA